jgi:hypothetical protein
LNKSNEALLKTSVFGTASYPRELCRNNLTFGQVVSRLFVYLADSRPRDYNEEIFFGKPRYAAVFLKIAR